MSRKLLIALLILATLTGCPGPVLTQYDLDGEIARVNSRTACVQALAAAEQARADAIARMPESQQALAMMADAMARQSEALAGKDRCASGMGAQEARVRIAESQNKAADGIIGSLARTTLIGLGIVEGADVVKTALKQSGNHTATTITGDGNSTSHEHNQVVSNVENNIKTGDESTGNVDLTNPNVSGPDNSTNETIHEAAPAATPAADEPEAEAEAPATEAAEAE
ncbi:MAG: hypothetical protein RBS40_13355 [Rhodocyclaceae bacterium]|jgi:hypothetical protein|nr:hypothetical protein [Rhodocyclaceae bacterium]